GAARPRSGPTGSSTCHPSLTPCSRRGTAPPPRTLPGARAFAVSPAATPIAPRTFAPVSDHPAKRAPLQRTRPRCRPWQEQEPCPRPTPGPTPLSPAADGGCTAQRTKGTVGTRPVVGCGPAIAVHALHATHDGADEALAARASPRKKAETVK